MFARVFALLPLALLVAANSGTTLNQCNTGSSFCCNSNNIVGNYQVPTGGNGGLVGVLLPIFANIDATCSVVAVTNCAQQPVCCNNVGSSGGLATVQCDSISL